jgi:hypothetical protein
MKIKTFIRLLYLFIIAIYESEFIKELSRLHIHFSLLFVSTVNDTNKSNHILILDLT